MTSKKLVIISVDALNSKDYQTLRTLPTFATFLEEGAYVRKVSSVYPTVTYTCHTSISTGHYPHAHGVYNNEFPDPERPTCQDWRWFEKHIKTPTLFDYGRQNGLTTACLLWPVMADSEVNWNVPEIWSPDDSVSAFKLMWNFGSRNMFLPIIYYSRLTDGKKQPALDNFTEALSHYVLRRKQPDITAIHFTELDSIRHIYGLDSKEASRSLRRIDGRIQKLLDTCKAAGTYRDTNFVLLGDHGTHDFSKIIELNHWFKKEGLPQAYACSCGGSCQIHLSSSDPSTKEKVYKSLQRLMALPETPIKAILSKEDAMDTFQLKGDFHWVLEARDGHVFRNGDHGGLIHHRSKFPGAYYGDHGYMPDHPDMATMLLMMGPDIKKGGYLSKCSLVDEGPTFAALMGMTMEKTEGRILSELIG